MTNNLNIIVIGEMNEYMNVLAYMTYATEEGYAFISILTIDNDLINHLLNNEHDSINLGAMLIEANKKETIFAILSVAGSMSCLYKALYPDPNNENEKDPLRRLAMLVISVALLVGGFGNGLSLFGYGGN